MRVAITGATGLVGTALREHWSKDGHELLVLSRRASVPPLTTVSWDVANGRFDASALEGIDAVVHLAGEPIAQRWSERVKGAIRASRVESTKLLVEGLKSLEKRPKVFVSASAVGFYGDGGDSELTESSSSGTGFLPETCQAWEHAAMEAMGLGFRTAVIRTGIVLSTKGGALGKMLLPFKLGLGGPVGSGRQWMPWVHIDDVVAAIGFIIEKDDVMGAVNVTAPAPARNQEFTKALAGALKRPAFLPAPAFALRIVLGEMSQILLDGQRVLPRKLIDTGYEFRYPELRAALEDVIKSKK